MDSLTTVVWTGSAVGLIAGLTAGYLLGARKSKRAKREMLLEMNAQSVELLEARAKTRKLTQYVGSAKRKDRVLKLALTRLKSGNARELAMRQQLENIDRKHFIDMSRLNMNMVESKRRAKQAVTAARKASFRLRLLEKALPQMQTISAPKPKSYGQGEAVTVNVVDKHAPVAKREQVNAMSHKDLHRFTALKSSNEQVRERPTNTVNFPQNNSVADINLTQPCTQDNAGDEQILPKKNSAKRAP